MPERKSRLPTRFACGNAPTGSGARELSKDFLILFRPTFPSHKLNTDEMQMQKGLVSGIQSSENHFF
jgi:hypothetical protein